MLPRSGEPIKKLGDLRRMLSLRRLARAVDRGPAQWIDDAQLKLGELHGLVDATWFQPSTTTPVATQAPRSQSQSPVATGRFRSRQIADTDVGSAVTASA